jgi:hypothetical protein
MWAITSYYNPVRFKKRLSNYKLFRANLHVPLVTVELSFDGQFDLAKEDADILVQITGGAVLWQKERLLNVAVKAIPPEVQNVAWLDCDVLFERADWVDEAQKQLTRSNIIQLFSDAVDLNADDSILPLEKYAHRSSAPSIVNLYEMNKALPLHTNASENNARLYNLGLAWAAKRGIYDSMILGSGDRALVCALFGKFEAIIQKNRLNEPQIYHYLKWAERFHRSVSGNVSYISGRLYHLWHGDLGKRHDSAKKFQFAELGFNPYVDIVVGKNKAWHWAHARPELKAFLMNYFTNRKEDG